MPSKLFSVAGLATAVLTLLLACAVHLGQARRIDDNDVVNEESHIAPDQERTAAENELRRVRVANTLASPSFNQTWLLRQDNELEEYTGGWVPPSAEAVNAWASVVEQILLGNVNLTKFGQTTANFLVPPVVREQIDTLVKYFRGADETTGNNKTGTTTTSTSSTATGYGPESPYEPVTKGTTTPPQVLNLPPGPNLVPIIIEKGVAH